MARAQNFRDTAKLARYIKANGKVDKTTGFAFSFPLTATDPIVTATSIANLPSSGNDFGRIGVVYENGTEEGRLVFWDGSSWADEASYVEIGGAQLPPTATAFASTAPNFGSQYYNTSVTISLSNTSKDVGEDPIATYTWTIGGQAVSTSDNGNSSITLYYPTITSDQNTTATCTLTDAQGQTTTTNTVTIQWRANARPTIVSFTTSAGSTTGNAPEPGTTVTLTITGSDPEGGSLQYFVTKTSGATITTNPSLGVWTNDNTFTFTVPTVDNGVDDYNQLVFEAKVRDSLNVESLSATSLTVNYKRSPRTAESFDVINITQSRRFWTNGTDIGATIDYPSNIQAGDVLVMFVSMAGMPPNTLWNGVTNGGNVPMLRGEDVNNSSNTAYSTSTYPNQFRGAPYIVSNQGWERAYNPSVSARTTPTTYLRDNNQCGSCRVQNTTAGGTTTIFQARETFYKVCTGSETGEIGVFADESERYAHRHHAENIFVYHLRLKSPAGVPVACGGVTQVFCNNAAYRDVTAKSYTSTTYHGSAALTIANYNLSNDVLFVYHHVQAGGDGTSGFIVSGLDATSGAENDGLNDGSTSGGIGRYRLVLSIENCGDDGSTSTFGSSDINTGGMREYTDADGIRSQRNGDTEYWKAISRTNDAIGESLDHGVFIDQAVAVQISYVRGNDANNSVGGNRDFRVAHERSTTSFNDLQAHGSIGILQFKAFDELYS